MLLYFYYCESLVKERSLKRGIKSDVKVFRFLVLKELKFIPEIK